MSATSRSSTRASGPSSSQQSKELLSEESWSDSLMAEGLENSRAGLEQGLNRAIQAYLQLLDRVGVSTSTALLLTLRLDPQGRYELRAKLQKL